MHSRTRIERRDYPCWAIVEPAPDIQGKWVAHCLEFDTLAQADDPETAVRLLLESTEEIVLEDLRAGMDPLDRRTPQDDEGWALLGYIAEQPQPRIFASFEEMLKKLTADNEDPRQIVIAVQFFLSYQRPIASGQLSSSKKTHTVFLQVRERGGDALAV